MRISDSIARYILQRMEQEDGTAEIQRNELAGTLGCVPSQINYVITSRFTPEQGYIVESHRGGGGYIRITRRSFTRRDMVMHIVNTVGDTLDAGSLRAMLMNMLQQGMLSPQECALISAATSNRALQSAPPQLRSALRADILKNMLLLSGDETDKT